MLPSTNTYLAEQLAAQPDLPELFAVMARLQTGGRGQRGNVWHAAPGKNITMSYLLRPQFLETDRQFVISELAAITVARTLVKFMDEEQRTHLTVKWPNDIYYDDQKIAGILIEHSLTGTIINYSIVGLGININETEFPKELPNPISLAQITGKQYAIEGILEILLQEVQEAYRQIKKGMMSDLHARYMNHLYRRDGPFYPYKNAQGKFMARIRTVQPNGIITLCHEDGTLHDYAFKELRYL